jgi:hypothetical protein
MTDAVDDTTKSGIAVIESKWNGDGLQMRKNASVRPMFDVLCDLHFGSTHEYVYEMVPTAGALANAIERLSWDSEVRVIYIATHGSAEGLQLHGEPEAILSRTRLSNMFSKTGGAKRKLAGVYLGACEFGTEATAKFLLGNDKRISWVAGYSCSSDFIDGTALDVMFFNRYLRAVSEKGLSKQRDIIDDVAEYLKRTCRGLVNTPEENGYDGEDEDAPGMGLSIYVRRLGPTGGIIDLLRDTE